MTESNERKPSRQSFSNRPHWSYSQISQFLRCPLQYYFERVAKLPRKTIPNGMALGSAIHKGLADYHLAIQKGDQASLDLLKSSFLEAYSGAEQQLPIDFKEKESRASSIEQGVALLEAYHKEPPPENIVAIEEPMLVPIITSSGDVLEKPLVAIVDLLFRDEEGLVVDEFKTSSRKYSESEAESTLQASCYVHAVREIYNEPAAVRYTVFVKTKTPSIQRLNTVRTADDFGRVGDIVQTIERAIEADAFYPIESPLNCSGCSFLQECRDWRGRHVPLASHASSNAKEAA